MRLSIVALLFGAVLSQSSLASAREMQFVTINVAPWAYNDEETGKPLGLFPAVMSELERRTGIPIRQTFVPYARIDPELEAAHQDCTIVITSDARSALVVKGETLSSHPMGVIARPGVKVERLEDLFGLTVSTLPGLSFGAAFDNEERIHKVYDSDYRLGLRKLAHKRIDAVVGAIPTIKFLAKQEKLEKSLGSQLMIEDMPLVLQCSRKSPNLDLMPALNKAILDMKADGTLNRLLNDNFFL